MGVKSVLSGVVAIGLLAAGGYALNRILDGRTAFPMTSECVATGAETVRLDNEQMVHAATIAAVGLRRKLPVHAVTVALATALQESKLRNLTNGDRDSVGLFQQRPSMGWGEPEQLNDPRYAAAAFYDRLQRVPGWQSLRVTEAAQAVQKSAHPEAYQKWAGEAEVLAHGLAGQTPAAVACAVTDPTPASSAAAVHRALTQDWGNVSTSELSGSGLSLPVRNDKTGWRFAHWLVAHAAEHGISRVRYAGHQWTADTGEWRTTKTAGDAVIADFRGTREG
ncbi:MAG: hypothetical protein ACRDT4_02865 [Micromonosporaceae bacterium]